MEGSGISVSFWGKRKTLHIVLAVITVGLWLLALLARSLWRKGRKGSSIATASALGLIVLLIGIGAVAATGSETTSPAIETATVTETTTEAAEPGAEPMVLATTFVSPRNGYSFKYLDRGGLAPAKEAWDPVNQPPLTILEFDSSGDPHNDQFDVVETGLAAVFKSASTEIPDGVSIDEWVDASVVKYLGGCYVPRSKQAEITIDGQSGRISEDCPPSHYVATVVAGGRLYLFVLLRNRSDARALLDAWISTIDLRPEAAAVG